LLLESWYQRSGGGFDRGDSIFNEAESLEILDLRVHSEVLICIKVLILEGSHGFEESALRCRKLQEVILVWTLS
jgi:hypothetical protein